MRHRHRRAGFTPEKRWTPKRRQGDLANVQRTLHTAHFASRGPGITPERRGTLLSRVDHRSAVCHAGKGAFQEIAFAPGSAAGVTGTMRLPFGQHT
jgi:hypothetical protein